MSNIKSSLHIDSEGNGYNTVSILMVQHNETPNIQCGAFHGPQIRHTAQMWSQKNKTMPRENKDTGNEEHGFFRVW